MPAIPPFVYNNIFFNGTVVMAQLTLMRHIKCLFGAISLLRQIGVFGEWVISNIDNETSLV